MTTTKKKEPKRISATGAELTPDLGKHKAGIVRKNYYWIGALPSCPSESVFVGSVDFPKMTEKVSGTGRDTLRIPGIGSIRELTEQQVRRIREHLPRVVIRFDGAAPEDIPGPGAGLDAVMPRDQRGEDGRMHSYPPPRRRGHLITIKTDEELKTLRDQRLPARPYDPMPNDEPAAAHIFAKLCDNQDQPQADAFYPEPLSVTGLEWPDEE